MIPIITGKEHFERDSDFKKKFQEDIETLSAAKSSHLRVLWPCEVTVASIKYAQVQHSDERGTFVVRRRLDDDWVFSDNIICKANGDIWWFTIKPMGVLIKYLCGTKRFIKGLSNLPE